MLVVDVQGIIDHLGIDRYTARPDPRVGPDTASEAP